MKIGEALADCERTVRRFDSDRYFASLFAPVNQRPLLFALYAFNLEIGRLREAVREPMAGEIRLQWWRGAVTAAHEGHPSAQPVCIALAELFGRAGPPLEPFIALIDAHSFDLGQDSFADLSKLESYCDATAGNLMRIAIQVLDVAADPGALAVAAGTAYALAGLLRAISFHAARRKLYLPMEMLVAESVSPDQFFSGLGGAGLARVVRRIADRAAAHWAVARGLEPPRNIFAAVLPAALVPLYLRQLKRTNFDPLVRAKGVPLYRRQLALLRAAALHRL